MTDPPDHPAGHPAEAWSPRDDLRRVADAVDACRACDLWARATQGVFGEGRRGATIVLVGEQPGDREDLVGRPFVGPAGVMLDKALEDAGIDRAQVYVTNAVKHFKWKPSGKRRLHEKPNAREVKACRPWLDLELDAVAPRVVMPLGATAASALLGPSFRITQQRGQVIRPDAGLDGGRDAGPEYVASFHPSAILRAPDAEARETMYAALVADLRVAAEIAATAPDDAAGPSRPRGDHGLSDRSARRSGSAPRPLRAARRSGHAVAAGSRATPGRRRG
jgi:uracil-DNA glycosylase